MGNVFAINLASLLEKLRSSIRTKMTISHSESDFLGGAKDAEEQEMSAWLCRHWLCFEI